VPLQPASLAFYDHVLRLDADGQWWFEALEHAAVERRLELLRRRLVEPMARRPWRAAPFRLHGAGAAGHRVAVADCVERIAAGELFQANLCLRLDGRLDGGAIDAFSDVAATLRPAYGAFIGSPGGALLSFSPELFLRRRGRDGETAPIKGTAPRTEDEAEAAAARAALQASVKDASEHVMIVDLMRNDLGRVADYGSVEAAVEPDVEAHPGLWHLVTRVHAHLRDGVTDTDLLRATFPPGSVTGAPKIQALKVISALEGTGREAYTGAIGIISPASGLELNVAIRTLEVRDGAAWMGCGGGIVADSNPGRELQEALDKVRPIAAALRTTITEHEEERFAPGLSSMSRLDRRPDPARGLLETILVQHRHAVGLSHHLDRLARSARELFDRELAPDGRRRISAAVSDAGSAEARLRVILSQHGTVEVTTAPVDPPPPGLDLSLVSVSGGLGPHKLADRAPLAPFEGRDRAALICDLDGAVLEASSGNVWAVIGDRLVTPPADGRILPGVIRHRLLEAGEVTGFAMIEAPLWLWQLQDAEGVIVTSSIRGAVAARLPGACQGNVALRLAADLRRALGHRQPRPPEPVEILT
jgi:para-aminobenzoate synthetase/4-amino-4-deoxychorismate lyase